MKRNKNYGWVKDNADPRDQWVQPPLMAVSLPKSVDLRPMCPPVYDQGDLGSCTGNTGAAAFQFTETEQRGSLTDAPSRLFVYYNTRVIQNTVNEDSGATIRDTIKSLNKYGVCREVDWPYKVRSYAAKPPKSCYNQAAVKRIKEYKRVDQKAYSVKYQLFKNNPILFGFNVFDSFESDEVYETGVMPMPDLERESIIGGHAVLAVGYIDDFKDGEDYAIVRNSYGKQWGDHGYFYMPMKFLLDPNYSDDLWTISAVP